MIWLTIVCQHSHFLFSLDTETAFFYFVRENFTWFFYKEVYMYQITKQSMIFFVIAAVVFVPFAAALAQGQGEEESSSTGQMTFDLLLIRPFGMLATLLGSAAFLVSLPFSALGGNVEPAYEKMVVAPALYTFDRPLGSF